MIKNNLIKRALKQTNSFKIIAVGVYRLRKYTKTFSQSIQTIIIIKNKYNSPNHVTSFCKSCTSTMPDLVAQGGLLHCATKKIHRFKLSSPTSLVCERVLFRCHRLVLHAVPLKSKQPARPGLVDVWRAPSVNICSITARTKARSKKRK
jgi:hypothetical protein